MKRSLRYMTLSLCVAGLITFYVTASDTSVDTISYDVDTIQNKT